MSMFEPLLPGQKPVGPVEIDIGHGIGRDMLWYYFALDQSVIEKNKTIVNPTTNGTGRAFKAIAGGRALTLGSNSGYHVFNDDSVVTDNINRQNFTWFVDFEYISDSGSTSFLFGNTKGDSTAYNWGLYYHNPSNSFTSFIDTSTGVSNTGTGNVTAVANKRYRYVVTYDGVNYTEYVNGIQIAQVAKTGDVNVTACDMSFNRWNNGSHIRCNYYSAGVINRSLSHGEAINVSNDPYQFLKPKAQLLKQPTLLINTQPTPLTYEYTVPDPKWEEPALLAGKKPTGPVVIDWEHPLSDGLTHYIHVNGEANPRDIVTGTRTVTSGGFMNPAIHPEIGQSLLCTNTGGQYRSLAATKPDATAPLTVCFEVESGENNAGGVFSWANSATSSGPWLLVTGNGVTNQLKLYINTGYRFTWDFPIGERQIITFTFNGSEVELWVNGVSQGTYTTSTTGTNTATNIYMASGYNTSYKGHYGNIAVYNRAFTASEAVEYARNPYQFLIPA